MSTHPDRIEPGDLVFELNPMVADEGKKYLVDAINDEVVTLIDYVQLLHGHPCPGRRYLSPLSVALHRRGKNLATAQQAQKNASSLRAHHHAKALRAYLERGVLHVLDHEGNYMPSVVDVEIRQSLAACQGRAATIVTLTALVNLYDTKADAMTGAELKPKPSLMDLTNDTVAVD